MTLKDDGHSRHLRTRRQALTALATVTTTAMWSGRALAAPEFEFRLATSHPAAHPINQRLSEAAVRLREATSGRVELRLFPAGQLGSDPDLLSQVRSGAIDIYNTASTIISPLVPAAAVANMGFAFASYEDAWRAMDGELGKFISAQVEKTGLIVPAKLGDNGFRHITSTTKPIRSPTDLTAYRIRVPTSPVLLSLFTALGAAPTAVNYNELYTALQTKLVDGQKNGLVSIESVKLYEVQKFCSLTSHVWDPFILVANRRSFSRLPADLAELVRRELDRSMVDQRNDVRQGEDSLRKLLSSKGLDFIEVDRAPFRQALRASGYYGSWKEKIGAEGWTSLERSVGSLT